MVDFFPFLGIAVKCVVVTIQVFVAGESLSVPVSLPISSCSVMNTQNCDSTRGSAGGKPCSVTGEGLLWQSGDLVSVHTLWPLTPVSLPTGNRVLWSAGSLQRQRVIPLRPPRPFTVSHDSFDQEMGHMSTALNACWLGTELTRKDTVSITGFDIKRLGTRPTSAPHRHREEEADAQRTRGVEAAWWRPWRGGGECPGPARWPRSWPQGYGIEAKPEEQPCWSHSELSTYRLADEAHGYLLLSSLQIWGSLLQSQS